MANAVTASTATRRHRPVFATVALAAFLAAVPSPTLPGLAPAPAPLQEAGNHDTLHDILAGLAGRDVAPIRHDNHSLRENVTPFSVRLTVDKNARHPLSGPVVVHRAPRLDALTRPLYLVALAMPGPDCPPVEAKPTAEASPKPAEIPAAPVVKTPSPHLAQAKAEAPHQTHRAKAAIAGHSVLVAGDSLSLFLADALRPMLAGLTDTAFASKGKVSSGLARPDFFNWEREMPQLVAASHPDTVVIMIATNDNQTLTRPDGSKVAFGRPGWEAEYARRVRRLVELARSDNPKARIFWVGAPVMGRPQLNTDVAAINTVIAKQIAALPDCHFIDVWPTLADASGHYAKEVPTSAGPRTARTPDGVHLTPFGAKLLANATLTAMSPTLAALDRP